MRMSAIVWAGIGGVVYGSSITTLEEAGIAQMMIGARFQWEVSCKRQQALASQLMSKSRGRRSAFLS
jgi:tRNA(Arg) A34 adenosine deaminase TadA